MRDKNAPTYKDHPEKTFQALLPLLNEDEYKKYVQNLPIKRVEQVEQMETIEHNEHKYEFNELNNLMKTTIPIQMTFEQRMENLLESMVEGELYRSNKEIYFKLQCNHNQIKLLRVFFYNGVKKLQNNYDKTYQLLHGNEHLVTLCKNASLYLHLDIEGINESNSSIFIYQTKQKLEKVKLKWNSEQTFNWNDYNNGENYILFLLARN